MTEPKKYAVEMLPIPIYDGDPIETGEQRICIASDVEAMRDQYEAKIAELNQENAELKSLAPHWQEQQKGTTHWDDCYLEHRDCAIARIRQLESMCAELSAEI